MINHSGTIDLQTERLLLRNFRTEDADDIYYGWTSDERVAKYTSWSAHPNIEATKGYVEYVLSQDSLHSYNWIIECEGKLIGTINVCYLDDNIEVAGFAYCLAYNSWGKGYATEALRAVINLLFEIGYRKIIAGCDIDNIGSKRVLEKVGMKQEACLRQNIMRKDGTYGDDLQFGLFIDEFIK